MAIDIPAHSLFSGPDRGLLENVVLQHDNGIITGIFAGAPPATSPRSLVLPAFVNAHDHARPTASSFGALGMPLESWILRSALGTPVDPYLTAASALARSARAGCGAMMIHYTRPSGAMPLVEEAGAIAMKSRFFPASPRMIAARSSKCSSVRRCRRKPISSSRTRSLRPSLGRRSTCSLVRPACNGAQNRCLRR